jgi:hypothetical protein
MRYPAFGLILKVWLAPRVTDTDPVGEMLPPLLAAPAVIVLMFALELVLEKLAVIVVFALIVVEHVPVPVHAPPVQPVKVEPLPGVAVSVITVPTL